MRVIDAFVCPVDKGRVVLLSDFTFHFIVYRMYVSVSPPPPPTSSRYFSQDHSSSLMLPPKFMSFFDYFDNPFVLRIYIRAWDHPWLTCQGPHTLKEN